MRNRWQEFHHRLQTAQRRRCAAAREDHWLGWDAWVSVDAAPAAGGSANARRRR